MEDYIVHIDFNGRDVIKVDAEDKEAAEKKLKRYLNVSRMYTVFIFLK